MISSANVPAAHPRHRVAVRSLCEFSAKEGDLELRFTPSPSAQEGMAGHATIAARRGPGYQREIPLHGLYESLAVRGRADGYDAGKNRLGRIQNVPGRTRPHARKPKADCIGLS